MRGPDGSKPTRLSDRLSPSARERRIRFHRKSSPVRTGIRVTSRSCSEMAAPAKGGATMRYYIGVDWADQEHAVWVEDEQGQRVSAGGTVPHSAAGFTAWGQELNAWRAQDIALWAAIERPAGRVVDFLLDHGVRVYPVNPKALDRARDRFRQSGAKDVFVRCPGAGRIPAHRSWAPDGAGAELGGRAGTQVADGRLPPPAPRADPLDEPTDRDVEGVLSARPGGCGADHDPAARVSADVSHPGEL